MIVLESWWFFLPILVANQCPGFAAYFDLPFAHSPVSRVWLGENKTLAAYYVAPLGAILTVLAQKQVADWTAGINLLYYNDPYLWLMGLILGLGAVMGDHAKSFIKRGFDLPPGAPWWPWDQIDYAIGGISITYATLGWIGWERTFIIILTALMIHPVGNRIGYYLGLRKVPW